MKQQYSLLSAMMQSHHWQLPHMLPCHDYHLTLVPTKLALKCGNKQEMLFQMTQEQTD